MARSATKSGRRPRPDAKRKPAPQQRGRSSRGNVANQGLFFERLRRGGVKWIFGALAVVFAVSFVAVGVGSGSTGLGDLLQGNFSGLFGGGGGPSVGKAEKEIAKHPNDPAGYKQLAQAYENKKNPDGAIPALEQYVKLRPHDLEMLQDLATQYGERITNLQTYGSAISSDTSTAQTSTAPLGLDPSTPLAKTVTTDPIQQGVSQAAQAKQSAVSAAISEAEQKQVATYEKIVAVQPDDAASVLQLAQAAQGIGDTPTAIDAYKHFLKVAPDDPSAPDIRKQLKALQTPASKATVTPSSGG